MFGQILSWVAPHTGRNSDRNSGIVRKRWRQHETTSQKQQPRKTIYDPQKPSLTSYGGDRRSQVLNAADNFKAIITTPAWRSKPSWMLVAARDRIINPDLERWYAERAKSHMVEVQGASHSVYVSRPKEVAALIEEAASHAK